MIEFMREGGMPMWAILALAFPAVALAIVHAAMSKRWSLAAALLPLSLVIIVALAAHLWARSRVTDALRMIDPKDRALLERVGDMEASRPWQLALGILGVVAIPIGVGEIRRTARAG